MTATTSFLLLYGSQTGNAEAIAKELKDEAAERKIGCRLMCMDELNDRSAKFEGENVVVMVCSTTGTGDAPDNASKLLRRVCSKKHPSDHLSHVTFTVLGLGDTNYSDFCSVPRKFQSKFRELGAKEFYAPGFADDGTGLDVVVEPWKEGFWPAVESALGAIPTQSVTGSTNASELLQPSESRGSDTFDAVKISAAAAVLAASSSDALITTLQQHLKALQSTGGCFPGPNEEVSANQGPAAGPTASVPIEIHGVELDKLKLPKQQPEYLVASVGADGTPVEPATSVEQYRAAIIHTHSLLTVPGSVKDTISVTMALTEEMQYAPGDTFALACPNEAKEVAEVIERLGLPEATLDSPLQLAVANGTKKRGAAIPAHLTGHGLTTRVCLAAALDLRAPLTKGGIRMLSEYASDLTEQAEMMYLSSRQGAAEYQVACKETRLSIIALLQAYQSCKIPLARLLEVVPAMRPRRYSAASSPLAGASDVRFILNVEDRGLCSTWLHTSGAALGDKNGIAVSPEAVKAAKLARGGAVRTFLTKQPGGVGDSSLTVVPLYHEAHANRFNLPDDSSTPLVLCGAGTGVAPLLGFLQHRKLQRTADPLRVFGETWLFFGCRNEAKDYFCRDELDGYLRDGTLSQLHLAFSRDDQGPSYVQDNITTHGAEVVRLMSDQGGVFFACGSSGCVDSLDNALTSILCENLKISRDKAIEMKIEWKDSGKIKVESFGA
eukprot:m.19586 g.19586  ORF g.19586 m.19586 type:complete len:722 (-) comp10003_c0_seq2:192-2357(-)